MRNIIIEIPKIEVLPIDVVPELMLPFFLEEFNGVIVETATPPVFIVGTKAIGFVPFACSFKIDCDYLFQSKKYII